MQVDIIAEKSQESDYWRNIELKAVVEHPR